MGITLTVPANLDSEGLHKSTQAAADKGFSVDQIPGIIDLWGESTGDPRVCIAILDGLVDQTHQVLRDSNLEIIDPLRLYPEQVCAEKDLEHFAVKHGTGIASLLFGSHASSVKGVAPGCKGVIVPVYGHKPDGELLHCSQQILASAIRGALDYGAHVINISGGELLPRECIDLQDNECALDSQLVEALRECEERNVLVFAAAGNDGCDCIAAPAASGSVIAVGAMSLTGQPLEFSNWGSIYQGSRSQFLN